LEITRLTSAAQNALRLGRTLHAVFLLVALLDLWLPLMVIHVDTQGVAIQIVGAFGFVALSNVGLAIYFRSRDVQPCSETLRRNPDDTDAAAKWRRGVILSLVFCISIVLLGLALRIIGAAWSLAGVFYAVGILLMLAWWPKLDLPPQ